MSALMLSNPFAAPQESAFGCGKWFAPSEGAGTSRVIYARAGGVQRTVKSTDCATGSFARFSRVLLTAGQIQSTLRGQAKAGLFPLYDLHQSYTLKNELLGKIRDLSELEPGWDGYTAKTPALAAIDEAEQFSSNLLPSHDFQLPTVTAATDGEVNFSWKNAHGYIDLGFYGDGSYSYFAKTVGGDEFMSDESLLNEPLPDQVMKIIRGI